jgi:hypothetical protein
MTSNKEIESARASQSEAQPSRWKRTLVALLLAPGLGTAAWFFVLSLFNWNAFNGNEDDMGHRVLEFVFSAFLFGSMFGVLGSLVLGAWAYRFLQDLGQTNPWAYIAIYPLIALLCGIVGPAVMFGGVGEFGLVALVAVPAGAFAGLAFWLIRRPDRIVEGA